MPGFLCFQKNKLKTIRCLQSYKFRITAIWFDSPSVLNAFNENQW